MVDERKVPEGWGIKKFSEVAPLQRGFDLPTGKIKKGSYPVVYSNGISNYHNEFKVKGPGVITGRSGTIGKVHYADGNYWPHNTALWVTDFKDNNPRFIYYLYTYVNLEKFATGSGVPTLNRNDVHSFEVLVPSCSEQKSIAEALSDTDNLIQSIENLIDKKRKIKQGAMQQLLTGKKRLPGFSGEWEHRNVESFGEIITGGTPPTGVKAYWNGSIPWVTPTDITSTKNIYTTDRKITNTGLSKLRKLPKNSVLITCIASIGKNAVIKKDGACNQQINAIIPSNGYDSDFLYYLFESNKSYLLSNAGITATNIISKKDFALIEFLVPKLDEQKSIAQVLSDMDAEIEALEEKLEKYKTIKQGMMQELLTGRIRLI